MVEMRQLYVLWRSNGARHGQDVRQERRDDLFYFCRQNARRTTSSGAWPGALHGPRRAAAHSARSERLDRTFVMVKPDGVQRGLVGEIVARLEGRGSSSSRRGSSASRRSAWTGTTPSTWRSRSTPASSSTSCPGRACSWWSRGRTRRETVRTLTGATNPLEAAPGTIRGDFGLEIGRNVIHAADSPESAAREMGIHFPDGVVEYRPDRCAGPLRVTPSLFRADRRPDISSPRTCECMKGMLLLAAVLAIALAMAGCTGTPKPAPGVPGAADASVNETLRVFASGAQQALDRMDANVSAAAAALGATGLTGPGAEGTLLNLSRSGNGSGNYSNRRRHVRPERRDPRSDAHGLSVRRWREYPRLTERQAALNGTPGLSPKINLVEGFRGVALAYPVRNASGITGGVSLALRPERLLAVPALAALGNTSHALSAVQTDGTIIFDTNPGLIGQSILNATEYRGGDRLREDRPADCLDPLRVRAVPGQRDGPGPCLADCRPPRHRLAARR